MYEYLHPSKHKTRHCTNGIKMFCVCWAGKKTIAMFFVGCCIHICVCLYKQHKRDFYEKYVPTGFKDIRP